MEGVRTTREEATLYWIVDQSGGQMENKSIMGRNSCNGKPHNLTVEVNDEELEDPLNYIPRDEDFLGIDYS